MRNPLHQGSRIYRASTATSPPWGSAITRRQQLGDIVFVELPRVGAKFDKGDGAAVVESVKAASDVFAPVSGEVVAVNDDVDAQPGPDQRGRAGPRLDLQAQARRPDEVAA